MSRARRERKVRKALRGMLSGARCMTLTTDSRIADGLVLKLTLPKATEKQMLALADAMRRAGIPGKVVRS